ncbi:acyltransferase family protein [Geodermatophilus sp. SYSU D01106]
MTATVRRQGRGLAPRTSGPTLGTTFSPRSNALALMRLVLAGTVAVAHGLDIGAGWQPVVGRAPLADLAVDGFFVLSGFLVVRSALRLPSTGRFAWHRFLRLMPGFWACLLVTAIIVAPLAAVLAGRDPLAVLADGESPAWRYVVVNAALPILQFDIAGITAPTGEDVLDGSLWTLQYEAACYVLVGVLGAAAVLRRRPVWVPAGCAVVWVALLAEHAGLIPVDVPVLDNLQLFRFLLLFLLGGAAWLYADRVPVGWPWLVGSTVVLAAALWLPDHRVVGAVAFAHLCLAAVARFPLRWEPRWDLSYGLYLYHWPVQFLLLLAGAAALDPASFVLTSLVLALGAATVSWLLVERPALRLKDLPRPASDRSPA